MGDEKLGASASSLYQSPRRAHCVVSPDEPTSTDLWRSRTASGYCRSRRSKTWTSPHMNMLSFIRPCRLLHRTRHFRICGKPRFDTTQSSFEPVTCSKSHGTSKKHYHISSNIVRPGSCGSTRFASIKMTFSRRTIRCLSCGTSTRVAHQLSSG
jgi:hypothetical protein